MLPSLTEPDGVSVLPVPTFGLSKVSMNAAVSPEARLPEVIVGVADGRGRAVVDLGVSGRRHRDRTGHDRAGGVGDEGHGVVVAAVAVVDRAGRR